MKSLMNNILACHTGQPEAVIEADADRDRWFRPEEAKQYGMIDAVVATRHELEAALR
ncbi:MAG: ATP-dependent Clp protease proteolytic subunit [Acidimicrobiales bacterium]